MRLRRWMLVTILLAVVAAGYVIRSWGQEEPFYPAVAASAIAEVAGDENGVPYYAAEVNRLQAENVPAYAGEAIEIDPSGYAAASPDAALSAGPDAELGRRALVWENGSGWTEWKVEVPADGIYELEFTYKSIKQDSSSSIFYGLEIDGQTPFSEAGSLEFVKRWRDKDVPFRKDAIGNEIRSLQTETSVWLTARMTNYAVSSEPLKFRLSAGVHTLRFTARNEPMAWGAIRLRAPEPIPDYAAYSAAGAETGDAAIRGVSEASATGVSAAAGDGDWFALIEGERYSQKSHPAVQSGTQNEPYVSPDGQGRFVYNILDGLRWKRAGEWAEWTFEVPSEGWYEIDVKYFQRFVGKANAYRTVLIDGGTPFRELLHYPFAYNDLLEVHTLGGADGEPFKFRLAAGEHTIRFVTDTSPQYPALLSLQDTVRELYDLEQRLRKLTGDYGANSGDAFRTWDIAGFMPDIGDRLEDIRDRLQTAMAYLDGLSGSKTDATQSLRIGLSIMDDLLRDVDAVPNKLGRFPDLQMRIGTWMDTLANGGMSIDFLVVREPGAQPSLKEATTLNKIPYTAVNFARTFILNYNARPLNDEHALEVWVGRGRDYASLLQEMIDQSFTPETGIAVNVNFMPDAAALTLSNAGGDQPDVALGLAQDTPVDYAMREASVDLSQFSDFEEVASRFHPGAMRSFGYGEGVYALPETQSYPLLFYRKSILNELGLTVPDTWEDLRKLLPTLQESGMKFYFNAKDFVPFFYQRNAEFYTPDGAGPAFDTDKAYEAFAQWTELFGKYDLPQEVPAFFQHFKLGTMPIGVADFNTYVQLLTSAPEIRGDWSVAPMPGTPQDDGEVARWAMNTMTAAMILNKSDKKEQAWRFLEWWTRDDVQLQYGNAMESFYGPEYRWNTANMKAMSLAPWPADDMAAIREQNRWVRNVPFLPGGYLLAREMEFAWNRTVVQKFPAKDSLDRSFTALEREMARKRKDLGLRDDDRLSFPVVDRPYDWGEEKP